MKVCKNLKSIGCLVLTYQEHLFLGLKHSSGSQDNVSNTPTNNANHLEAVNFPTIFITISNVLGILQFY